MSKLPAKISELDIAIKSLTKEKGFVQAQNVINKVSGLLGIETNNTWKLFNDSQGKIRQNAGWFKEADGFADRRASYKIAEGNAQGLDLKAFWMKQARKSVISWLVALTPNFEDEPFYGTLNVGIDFVIPEKADRVIVILSKNYVIRTLELTGELSITQQEIFSKWLSDFDFTNKAQIHEALWQSFDIEPLNKRFYKEISSFFVELKGYLTKENIFDDRHASYFVNRLIGRVVFCWFLEKKNIINSEIGYFDTEEQKADEFYRNKLETLFFKVFNTPIEDRDLGIDDKTPFLNGGLFDPKEGDKFGDSSLTFPADYFDRFFKFLKHYNFTTDESTSTFQQVAIDPEMLGRIFENLLAEQVSETGEQARKAKGAFYTPREIVDYMCRESLREYLKGQLGDEGKSYEVIDKLLDSKEHDWRDQQTNYRRDLKPYKYDILKALDNMTIIDPACGSGAFPMGMLSLLLESYERLESTFDPYKKKLNIIKNNLFGVDIEPMAVEISRLRAWLSIVVDEENIEPLPNLDFKFVCANSLLPLKKDEGLFDKQGLKEEMQEVRDKYYNARTKKSKENLKKKFEKLIEGGQRNMFASDKENQLKSYHPFDEEVVAEFFDSEFMFGIEGFDVVIGNPPYVSLEKIKENKEEYKKVYDTAAARGDLYCLFYERGLSISKQDSGLLTFITSNKWMRANYGKDLRKYFSKRNPLKLLDFGGFKVFESATVDTNILIIENQENKNQLQACHFQNNYNKGEEISTYFKENKIELQNINSETWFIGNKFEVLLKNKIEQNGKKLKEWNVKIARGVITGFNEAFIIDQAKRDELVATDPQSENIIKPILSGKDIKRYNYNWNNQYIIITKFGSYKTLQSDYPAICEHLKKYETKLKARGQCKYSRTGRNGINTDYEGQHHWLELDNNLKDEYLDMFEVDKIAWGNLGLRSQFSLVKSGIFINAPSPLITPCSKYLIAILNSSLGDWYIRKLGVTRNGGYFEYKPMFVDKLPIPQLTPQNQPVTNKIEYLVDQILTAKKDNPKADTSELEVKIDELVFDLYELTEEEREVVLNS
jgi:hypothetical protein